MHRAFCESIPYQNLVTQELVCAGAAAAGKAACVHFEKKRPLVMTFSRHFLFRHEGSVDLVMVLVSDVFVVALFFFRLESFEAVEETDAAPDQVEEENKGKIQRLRFSTR